MAIQSLSRGQSTGDLLAQGFGTGLGTGLGGGLQDLFQGLQQQQQQKLKTQQGAQFWEGLGLNPEMAYQFASAPDPVQKSLLDRLEGLQLGGAQQGVMGQQPGALPQQLGPGVQGQVPTQGGIRLGASPLERRHRETLGLKQEKMDWEKKKYINETYLKPFREKAETAQKEINDYNQLIPLLESGKVFTGKGRALLEHLGLADFVTNPETAQAQAILKRRATGAANAFNTKRLTNLEVSTFKDSLARLRDPILASVVMSKNAKLAAKAELVKKNVANEIAREGKFLNPLAFEDELDKRVQPHLKKFADKALRNVEQALEKQHKRTASQAFTEKNAPEGKPFRNKRTGELFIKRNGILVPYKGRNGTKQL